MLKVIALAAAIAVLNIPTASAGEGTEKCGTKVTWRGVKCILWYNDAKANCITAEKFERYAKHADLDGDLNGAQKYRNIAAFRASECKRLLELHEVEYPKQ